MASGYKTELFNAVLAGLLAAASAFAIFAMPDALLRAALDGIGLAAAPIGTPTRTAIIVAGAITGFLFAWIALRNCDLSRRRPDGDVIDRAGQDWPSVAGIAARSIEPEPPLPDLDDPFAELARGAQRIDEPLELTSEQIAPAQDEPMRSSELASIPSAGASGLIQRLNAGLASSEWPLPDDADEAEDRLRGVLRQLRTTSRGA